MPSRSLTSFAVAACSLALAAGCSAPGQTSIGADTKCSDYMEQPGDVRQDAAVRLSTDIDGVDHPGNPMWALSLDGACGSSPDMTLGEYFRHD